MLSYKYIACFYPLGQPIRSSPSPPFPCTMSHKQISIPLHMPQAALLPQPEGGFTIYGETISTSFVVDEQGRLSPSLSDYLSICNSPAYQDKLLEVFLRKWKRTGPPTAPEIQSITQEVCD